MPIRSDVPAEELKEIKAKLDNPEKNPRDIKRNLARTLVRMYHSEKDAQFAEAEFDKIFIKKILNK